MASQNEDIVAHIRDDAPWHQPVCDHCKLSPGIAFDWYFCPGSSRYYGDFTWGSKQKTVSLYSSHIIRFCGHKFLSGTEHCYWLVKADGFYVAKKDLAIDDLNWSYESSWI